LTLLQTIKAVLQLVGNSIPMNPERPRNSIVMELLIAL